MDAIENIIVPYKNDEISRMGLPSNQHTTTSGSDSDSD